LIRTVNQLFPLDDFRFVLTRAVSLTEKEESTFVEYALKKPHHHGAFLFAKILRDGISDKKCVFVEYPETEILRSRTQLSL